MCRLELQGQLKFCVDLSFGVNLSFCGDLNCGVNLSFRVDLSFGVRVLLLGDVFRHPDCPILLESWGLQAYLTHKKIQPP